MVKPKKMAEIKPIRGVVLRDAMELTGATVTVVNVDVETFFHVVADNGERFIVPYIDIVLVDLPELVQRSHDLRFKTEGGTVEFILYGVSNYFFHGCLMRYLEVNEFSHIKPKT